MIRETSVTTVKDPVCGMEVDPATTKHSSEYRGRTSFFCSLMCLKAFEDDPLHYLNKHPHQGRRVEPPPATGR